MKSKPLLMLVIILAGLVAVAYLVVDVNLAAPQRSTMGLPLFSDLPVNRVAAIGLTDADGSVTLKKDGSAWVVSERFGFPADFDKISDLVRKTAAMQIGHGFEIFPDTLSRLQLHDPAAAEVPRSERGQRVIFRDDREQALLDIILGKSRQAAMGGGGHFVLPTGSQAGYLVAGNFERVGRRPSDWIKNTLLDIKPEAIWRVVCEDPESGRIHYTLERPQPGQDPLWSGAQPGAVLRPFRFDSVYRALINLGVEDVAGPAGNPPFPGFESRPRLVYTLYDGSIYSIYPGGPLPGEGDRFYFRVQTAYDPPAERVRSQTDGSGQETAAHRQEQAAQWNATIGSWIYVIAGWKHSSFVVDPAEFTET